MSLIITIAMQFLAAPITSLMQVPPEATKTCIQYIQICCGGAIFICAYNVIGSVFRGIGDSNTPLIAVAISCVLNIFGDLLFVVVIPMEAAGAALATVIAQGLSVVICILIVHFRKLPFDFGFKNIKFNLKIISKVLKLGLPIAFQDLLVSISFLVLTAIINQLGVTASAGVGVAEKVCAFIMLVPSSYMQSISTFVAQNIGANNYKRARKALFYGIFSSLCVGTVIGALSFFHGDIMATIFSKEADVIKVAHDYLKAYAIDCIFVSFLFCFCGYFNGCSKTRFIMCQGIIGTFGVRIPVAYFVSKIEPVSVFHIGLATPCSTVIQILICVVYFLIFQHLRKTSNLMK